MWIIWVCCRVERLDQRGEMCGCNYLGIPAELFREGEGGVERKRERAGRRERESGKKGGKRQIGRERKEMCDRKRQEETRIHRENNERETG